MRLHHLAATVAALSLAGAVSAHAETFDLFFDADGTSSDVHATLNATNNGDGTFTVTGISAGFVGTDAITGFTQNPSAPATIISADGLYLFNDLLPVDYSGLLFTDSGASHGGVAQEDNLYLRLTNPNIYNLIQSPATYSAGVDGSLTLTQTGVPEPASWALMILGFGGIGAEIRKRRRMLANAIPA